MKGDKNMLYFYRMVLTSKKGKFLGNYVGVADCDEQIKNIESFYKTIDELKEIIYEENSKKFFPNIALKDIDFDILAFNPL